jgi:hypothetical protein
MDNHDHQKEVASRAAKPSIRGGHLIPRNNLVAVTDKRIRRRSVL